MLDFRMLNMPWKIFNHNYGRKVVLLCLLWFSAISVRNCMYLNKHSWFSHFLSCISTSKTISETAACNQLTGCLWSRKRAARYRIIKINRTAHHESLSKTQILHHNTCIHWRARSPMSSGNILYGEQSNLHRNIGI